MGIYQWHWVTRLAHPFYYNFPFRLRLSRQFGRAIKHVATDSALYNHWTTETDQSNPSLGLHVDERRHKLWGPSLGSQSEERKIPSSRYERWIIVANRDSIFRERPRRKIRYGVSPLLGVSNLGADIKVGCDILYEHVGYRPRRRNPIADKAVRTVGHKLERSFLSMTRIYGMEKRRQRKASERARTKPAAIPRIFFSDAPHYLALSIAALCLSAPFTELD